MEWYLEHSLARVLTCEEPRSGLERETEACFPDNFTSCNLILRSAYTFRRLYSRLSGQRYREDVYRISCGMCYMTLSRIHKLYNSVGIPGQFPRTLGVRVSHLLSGE